MNSAMKNYFIIIDDDQLNNMICSRIIDLTLPGSGISTFTSPENGVDYLSSNYITPRDNPAILFLDINMPSLTGWDVLDKISAFPERVKENLKIYMLSSSVDQQDKEKAGNHPLVSGYVTKPLSKVKLMAIFD
jgi:two-component system chemotaxis response regulator CheY